MDAELIKGIVIIVLFYGFLCISFAGGISGIKEKRRERQQYIKREKELMEFVGERLLCQNCSYSKKRLRKPYYHSYDLAYMEPYYCRKFRTRLPSGGLLQRCIAKDPDKARRQKKNVNKGSCK